MRRRAFLATGLAAATAGCLSGDGGTDDGGTGTDDGTDTGAGTDDGAATGGDDAEFQDPDFDVERNDALPGEVPDPSVSTRGLAPEPEAVDPPEVDVDALETYDRYEEPVPLLPVDAAYAWYRRRDARFVDARSLSQYRDSHVTGAALSPAPDGQDSDDPVANWPETERIVTYCGCPHHLSGWRASTLRGEGHPAVFAIDEGFWEWVDREYPTAASGGQQASAPRRVVTGSVDPAYAGELVWVRDEETAQKEPGVVADDGSYSVGFHFVDLDPADRLRIETPEGVRTATVAELGDGSA